MLLKQWLAAENNCAREKLFPGLLVFRRHRSTSLRQWFLKVDQGMPALGSREMLPETEGFDHNPLSQSNKLRYYSNLDVVKNKLTDSANVLQIAYIESPNIKHTHILFIIHFICLNSWYLSSWLINVKNNTNKIQVNGCRALKAALEQSLKPQVLMTPIIPTEKQAKSANATSDQASSS